MQDSCDTLSNNNLTKATLIDYANYERLITFCTNFCWPFVSAYIYTSYCCISLHPFANALRQDTTKPVYNLYSKGLSEHVETIYNHCEVKYVLSSIQFIRKMVNWLCFIIKSFYSFFIQLGGALSGQNGWLMKVAGESKGERLGLMCLEFFSWIWNNVKDFSGRLLHSSELMHEIPDIGT